MKKSISLLTVLIISVSSITSFASAQDSSNSSTISVDSILSQTKVLDNFKLFSMSKIASGESVSVNENVANIYMMNKIDVKDELANRQKFVIYDKAYTAIRLAEAMTKLQSYQTNKSINQTQATAISDEISSRLNAITMPSSSFLKPSSNILNCLIGGCAGDPIETTWTQDEHKAYSDYKELLVGVLEKIDSIKDRNTQLKLKDTIRKYINSNGNTPNDKYSILFIGYKILLEKLGA